jgi:hypothetical protein
VLTIQVLVHFLYTSSLPPAGSSLCTPQILCSLLQLARPYQIDGLLEATVERLHQVLDGRNAAAVFNAAAMAAGGGRGTGFNSGLGGTLEALNGANARTSAIPGPFEGAASHQSVLLASDSSDTENGGPLPQSAASSTGDLTNLARGIPSLRIDTSTSEEAAARQRIQRDREDSISNASTATSASSASFSQSDSEFVSGDESRSRPRAHHRRHTDTEMRRAHREIWTGDLSSVIGLQKRGLRGLMEGRRLRERNIKPSSTGSTTASFPLPNPGDSYPSTQGVAA